MKTRQARFVRPDATQAIYAPDATNDKVRARSSRASTTG